MRALITNDDGIDSIGLRTLARAAAGAGLDLTIAAPDGERSGSGAALTGLAEGGRLLVEKRKLDGLEEVPTFAVQASPAMIAFAGSHAAFGERPDIVLAGINRGPNIGRAILHSGTVGAGTDRRVGGPPGDGALAGFERGRALGYRRRRHQPRPGMVPAARGRSGGRERERAR